MIAICSTPARIGSCLLRMGRAAPFDGDLDDYRDLVLAQRSLNDKKVDDRKDGVQDTPVRRADLRRAAAHRRVALAPLRRRVAAAEARSRACRLRSNVLMPCWRKRSCLQASQARLWRWPKCALRMWRVLASAEEDWLTASAALKQETT